MAIDDEPSTVLDLVLSYGATCAGYSVLNALPEDERDAIYDGYGLPEDVEWLEWVQQQGASKCGLTLGGGDCEDEYFRLEHHLEEWESRHGPDALVRIKTDVCLEVLQGRGMSFREFRVLYAIYSAIGQSAYRRITLDTIRVRASGCKSAAVMKAEAAAGRPQHRERDAGMAVWRVDGRGLGHLLISQRPGRLVTNAVTVNGAV